MAFELDHLFICAAVGAPEAGVLAEFGLAEGGGNVHPGQGTANRRFFFRNAMLELLWLRDEREARRGAVAPARLYERCRYRETGASPFGLCLRPAGRAAGEAPFGYWEYRPPYLPGGVSVQVAENSTQTDEPLLFYLPFGTRPDAYAEGGRQPLGHRAGLEEITSVRITVAKPEPHSAALRGVSAAGWLSVVAGGESLLEVGFDGEGRGRRHDFRPALPLAFRW